MANSFLKLYVVLMALLSLSVKDNGAINIPQALATKSSLKNTLIRDSWKPIDWISIPEIEAIPALDTITWQELQQMPINEATHLIERICE